jgi:RNA polymerase sigma-70 factor (ECF subfamily)
MDSLNNREQESAQAASDGAASLDAAQFAALLDRCDQRIHGYILNRVRNRETASDLTQDALSKAWASRATFDPKQDELAWIITIASNVIADHVKSLKAQKRQPAAGQQVPRGDGRFATGPTLDAAGRFVVDPVEKMIDAEQIATADAAIARLDPSKRQAIDFRQAGLSYDEIAARMGLKNGTVGSLISRAIKELQEMVRAEVE